MGGVHVFLLGDETNLALHCDVVSRWTARICAIKSYRTAPRGSPSSSRVVRRPWTEYDAFWGREGIQRPTYFDLHFVTNSRADALGGWLGGGIGRNESFSGLRSGCTVLVLVISILLVFLLFVLFLNLVLVLSLSLLVGVRNACGDWRAWANPVPCHRRLRHLLSHIDCCGGLRLS